MRFLHHGAWFLRLREERSESCAAARAARLGGGSADTLDVVCAWHESVQGLNVTHTICPACLRRMMDEIDQRTPKDERGTPGTPSDS